MHRSRPRKSLVSNVALNKLKSEQSISRINVDCYLQSILKNLDSQNCSEQVPDKKHIIILPLYIINNNPVSYLPDNDISGQYDIELKSPENENLYVTNHYVLLQIITQYIYYRKLCNWVKEELKKKRLELLNIAKNILFTISDSNIYDIDNINKAKLIDEEEKFLLQYAEESPLVQKITQNRQKPISTENIGVQVYHNTGSKGTQYTLKSMQKSEESEINNPFHHEGQLYFCDKYLPEINREFNLGKNNYYVTHEKTNLIKVDPCIYNLPNNNQSKKGCCTIQ